MFPDHVERGRVRGVCCPVLHTPHLEPHWSLVETRVLGAVHRGGVGRAGCGEGELFS